jgi:hypothetical protein
MPATSVPVIQTTWTTILDNVEQALTQTLTEVAERERQLEPPLSPAASAEDLERGWRQRLEQCDLRLRDLEACVLEARRNAAEADAALQASEETLQAWLTTATATRQKLADGQGHPVS